MRTPIILAHVVLASALLAAGCAVQGAGRRPIAGPAPLSPAAERGQRLAEARCGGCHAVGLDEKPAASGPRFRDLRTRYNALSLQKRFVEISQHGTGEMPPIQISNADAEDLIAYFDSLGGR
ncbi:c-type cytochrome [Phenylobacterium sp.]|uniref:c-type cytochrome n=1 Tax=Phenylobacterium sp. TaxID=1871053 RepID=UPI00391C2DF6